MSKRCNGQHKKVAALCYNGGVSFNNYRGSLIISDTLAFAVTVNCCDATRGVDSNYANVVYLCHLPLFVFFLRFIINLLWLTRWRSAHKFTIGPLRLRKGVWSLKFWYTCHDSSLIVPEDFSAHLPFLKVLVNKAGKVSLDSHAKNLVVLCPSDIGRVIERARASLPHSWSPFEHDITEYFTFRCLSWRFI